MVETVIAVLVFGLLGAAVLSGLATIHRSGASTKRQSVAENIARNQMENVLSVPYLDPPSSYPTVNVPDRYAVTASAVEYVPGDPNIAEVVVTVTFASTQVLVLKTLRVK